MHLNDATRVNSTVREMLITICPEKCVKARLIGAIKYLFKTTIQHLTAKTASLVEFGAS